MTTKKQSTDMTISEILCQPRVPGSAGAQVETSIAKKAFCEAVSTLAPRGTQTIAEEVCNRVLRAK